MDCFNFQLFKRWLQQCICNGTKSTIPGKHLFLRTGRNNVSHMEAVLHVQMSKDPIISTYGKLRGLFPQARGNEEFSLTNFKDCHFNERGVFSCRATTQHILTIVEFGKHCWRCHPFFFLRRQNDQESLNKKTISRVKKDCLFYFQLFNTGRRGEEERSIKHTQSSCRL